MRKSIIHIMVIIALVTATISPACAFMNGQWMEICNGDTVQSVLVITDKSPNAPTNKKQDPCQFCFQFSHGSGMVPDTIITLTSVIFPPVFQEFYTESALSQFIKTRQSRAPPALVFS